MDGRALLLLVDPTVGMDDFEPDDAELAVASPIKPGPFFKPERTEAHPLLTRGSFSNFLRNGLGRFSSSFRSYTGAGGRLAGLNVGMLVGPETAGRDGAEIVERRRRRCRGESQSDTESIRTDSGESREARVAPARRVVRAGSGGTGGMS